MPKLIPSNKFLEDLDRFKSNKAVRKKLAKALNFLETNPLHPGLHVERIVNDPSAWSARVDKNYRISFEPSKYCESGQPDWSSSLLLLRILTHDDLYKTPH